jgi:hypothetical protein
MTNAEPKIFGIGLSKTATTSLDRALNELGIKSIHFPHDPTTYRELSCGTYQLTILERFRAATDISVSPFYAQLDKAYPNSKFILTIRDVDAWLQSIREHFEFMWQWAAHDRHFHKFVEFITACVYGAHYFQRDRFVYVYRQHLKNVHEYFANRRDDLLTVDICAGEGWKPLCTFLHEAVPQGPFPCANRQEEKSDRAAWIDRLVQAAREFSFTIPDHERYVLIDEQGLAGTVLDDPERARRPFQRNGSYWGAPTDTAGAIAEIERLRAIGINYLVFAWPALWWLDHYAELDCHLKNRFRILLSNERLLIMDMRTPAKM